MTKKLRVAVIGVGGIAATHFPGWKASPHAELVAFGDINPEKLHKAADQWGIDKALRYEDSWELFRQADVDIVDICTPNMYHRPLTVAALEHGKHVICEKPLAPTPQDVEQMIAARDKSGKLLMTAQHFRFSPDAKALKAEVDSGVLGDVYHARSWMLRRNALVPSDTFLEKKHSGGGPCIDIGVHILDLTLWMMGNPKPVTVSGVTQDKLLHQKGAWSIWGGAIPGETADVEDFAAALVRFENGATLVLEVSWLLHHKTSGEDMQMWLYGDKGGAHYPSNELLTSQNERRQQFNTLLVTKPGGLEAHAEECKVFAEAVAEGRPSPVPAEQSLDVMRILDGLYRSADARREVEI